MNLRSATMIGCFLVTTAGLISAGVVAADGEGSEFSGLFEARTVRMDLTRAGVGPEEVWALEAVGVEGPWGGPRRNLIDGMNLGVLRFRLEEAGEQGRTIFSRGFSSLYDEWLTTAEARDGVRRSMVETLRFPLPREQVSVVVERRDSGGSFAELARFPFDPTDYRLAAWPAPPPHESFTIQHTGPAAERVDLVLVGDGYPVRQREKFQRDARRLTRALFDEPPFAARRGAFNVTAVLPLPNGPGAQATGADRGPPLPDRGHLAPTGSEHAPVRPSSTATPAAAKQLPHNEQAGKMSALPRAGGPPAQLPFANAERAEDPLPGNLPAVDAGPAEPRKGIHPEGAVCSFDTFGSPRYLLPRRLRRLQDLAGSVPHDFLVVMVNTSRYGGGGIFRQFTVFTSDGEYSAYLFLHEFGHGFAGLGDEYYSSQVAYEEFYPKGVEPWEPNLSATADRERIKWRGLLSPGVPLPTPDEADYDGVVGAFEGGGYVAHGIFRPARRCKMKDKGAVGYCPVCSRAIERMIAFTADES